MYIKLEDHEKIIEDLIKENYNSKESIRGLFKVIEDRRKRIEKLESLVKFITNDYLELSYEKVQWQRDDWRKRCCELLKELE